MEGVGYIIRHMASKVNIFEANKIILEEAKQAA